MIDTTLEKLIAFLESASPVIWATLLKQVYIDAFAFIVWSIALVVVGVLLAKLGNYGREQAENDRYSAWELGLWLAYSASALSILVGFSLLVSSIMRFMNPEFYAIRYLLTKLVGA